MAFDFGNVIKNIVGGAGDVVDKSVGKFVPNQNNQANQTQGLGKFQRFQQPVAPQQQQQIIPQQQAPIAYQQAQDAARQLMQTRLSAIALRPIPSPASSLELQDPEFCYLD